MRFVAAAAILSAVLAAPLAPANADIDARPISAAEWLPLGDGERFVAWQVGDRITIMDDRGPTRTLRSEEPCGVPDLAVALGSGRLLMKTCRDERLALKVLDLRDGTVRDAAPAMRRYNDPLPERYGSESDPYFSDIGARWIEVHTSGHHWMRRVYHDWHTGRVIDDSGMAANALGLPDVDRAGLYRPPCSPLKRPRDPFDDDGYTDRSYYADVQYNGRFAVFWTNWSPVIWRCGTKRAVTLPGCRRGCTEPKLTDTHVAWVGADTRVRVRALRSRRVHRVLRPVGATPVWIALSGRRLLISGHDRKIYAARLPAR